MATLNEMQTPINIAVIGATPDRQKQEYARVPFFATIHLWSEGILDTRLDFEGEYFLYNLVGQKIWMRNVAALIEDAIGAASAPQNLVPACVRRTYQVVEECLNSQFSPQPEG